MLVNNVESKRVVTYYTDRYMGVLPNGQFIVASRSDGQDGRHDTWAVAMEERGYLKSVSAGYRLLAFTLSVGADWHVLNPGHGHGQRTADSGLDSGQRTGQRTAASKLIETRHSECTSIANL